MVKLQDIGINSDRSDRRSDRRVLQGQKEGGSSMRNMVDAGQMREGWKFERG